MINKYYRRALVNCSEITSEDIVYEIGPGTGLLTEEIITFHPKKLILIEFDKDMCNYLSNKLSLNYCSERYEDLILNNTSITLINADASNICPVQKRPIICGNLPYNIATHLILQWIRLGTRIKSINITIQKEVADRILADKRTKDYSSLSVIAQYHANCERIADISPGSFHPKPRVWSSVIRIIPKRDYNERFVETAQKLFHHRRKMIKYCLKDHLSGLSHIDCNKRAEELTLAEIESISEILSISADTKTLP